MSYTPLPWIRNGCGISNEPGSASICACAGENGQENAELIVLAVNAYAKDQEIKRELVATLTGLRMAIEDHVMDETRAVEYRVR